MDSERAVATGEVILGNEDRSIRIGTHTCGHHDLAQLGLSSIPVLPITTPYASPAHNKDFPLPALPQEVLAKSQKPTLFDIIFAYV